MLSATPISSGRPTSKPGSACLGICHSIKIQSLSKLYVELQRCQSQCGDWHEEGGYRPLRPINPGRRREIRETVPRSEEPGRALRQVDPFLQGLLLLLEGRG